LLKLKLMRRLMIKDNLVEMMKNYPKWSKHLWFKSIAREILVLLHSLLHKTHYTPTSFHSKLCLEQKESMIDPKPTDIMMEMVMKTLSMTEDGVKVSLKLLHLLLLRTLSILTSSHSRLSPEIEFLMTDPKLTNITMAMVMLTPRMTEDGKPSHKLLHLLPHRTQNIPMNFHSRLFLEIEFLMIDPKLINIMTEMVMLILKTMDHGKHLCKCKEIQPQFQPHKTQNTPMNFLSRLCPEIEYLMIDPKPTDIMMAMVTSTPNMMVHGKELKLHLLKERLPHSLLHRTHYTPTSFHSKLILEKRESMIDPKPTDIMMEMVTSTPSMTEDGVKVSPNYSTCYSSEP